jgi:hypothetical protein
MKGGRVAIDLREDVSASNCDSRANVEDAPMLSAGAKLAIRRAKRETPIALVCWTYPIGAPSCALPRTLGQQSLAYGVLEVAAATGSQTATDFGALAD